MVPTVCRMNPCMHDLFSEEKPDQHLLCTAILLYILVLSDKKELSLHNCQIINNLQKDYFYCFLNRGERGKLGLGVSWDSTCSGFRVVCRG